MDSLTITITQPRAIDGLIDLFNSKSRLPRKEQTFQEFVEELVRMMGENAANGSGIGTISAAEFILRFKPEEYQAITLAANTNSEIDGLLKELCQNAKHGKPVDFRNERLIAGLTLLASAGLLSPERVPELLSYDRPEPIGA